MPVKKKIGGEEKQISDYDRVNNFLKDHGHEVKGGWEMLTPGIAIVRIMDVVIEIIENIEKRK